MRAWTLSFFTIAWASCASCCCGGLPTFGLWPHEDTSAIEAAVRAAPIQVDHLCQSGETCSAVEGAEVQVIPVAWYPWNGEVGYAVQVDATCRDEKDNAKKIACAGVLGAVMLDGSVEYVTEDVTFLGTGSKVDLETFESTDVDWD